ncbi:MAG: hypothetical protein KGL39_26385 [Patescibacteria group bacterium]|nr:hypothetical protein [Patescibacteria group bacterium]
MNPNAPIPYSELPSFREGTSLASVRDDRNVSKQWKHNKNTVEYLAQAMDSVQKSIAIITKQKRNRYGGGLFTSSWDWMYPDHKELDTRYPYLPGKWAYISAKNTLVTTGMTDVVSNVNTISCQGLWECCQIVPSAVGGKFNVPVFPYPAGAATKGGTTFLQGTTAPSGTPLVGDLDLVDPSSGQKILFWIYRGDI